MTVAAREAVALQHCLRGHGTAQLAKRFFAAARREIANPWEISGVVGSPVPGGEGRGGP